MILGLEIKASEYMVTVKEGKTAGKKISSTPILI